MPIPSYFNIKPTAKTIRTDKPLKGNNSEWMVWWYCGIYKNHLVNSQPNVLVAFREIIDGNISDNVIMQTAQLTALGQLTVGSIWKDRVCRAVADFTVRDFEVDFRVEGWRFTSFKDTSDRGVEPPWFSKRADVDIRLTYRIDSSHRDTLPHVGVCQTGQ